MLARISEAPRWHMEAFQIPRRRVSRYFGIARSTLYRWLHKIADQKPSNTAANKTPTELATLAWEITKANLSWGLWTIQVLMATDRFSRRVVCVAPLEGPDAGWIIKAPEQTMRKYGAPKHIISDQAPISTGDAFAELLDQ
jgi:hypothetical protein